MKTVDVVAAVIIKDGLILATKRGYGDFIDMWEFPGGKMEPGETKEETLRREIQEELEIEIQINDFLCTVDYDYPSFHLTMHCYICSIVNGDLTLVEHNDARWLAVKDMDSVDWLPADMLLLDNIRRRYAHK